MHVLKTVALTMCLFAGALGCKKTAEGEQKTWNSNQEAIQKLEAKYPSFKPAFEDLLTSAKKDFDDAKGNPDKMNVANEKVSSATDMFGKYEKDSDRLKKLMADPSFGTLPANQINPLTDAAKAAQKQADTDIQSKPANIGEAKAKAEDADKVIAAAADSLDALKKTMAGSAAAVAKTVAPAGSAAAPAPAGSAAPAGSGK